MKCIKYRNGSILITDIDVEGQLFKRQYPAQSIKDAKASFKHVFNQHNRALIKAQCKAIRKHYKAQRNEAILSH